jgi:hypothetical protein
LTALTSHNQAQRDRLAPESVDALALDDARVGDPDGPDLEDATVQPESVAPSPLDQPVVLK